MATTPQSQEPLINIKALSDARVIYHLWQNWADFQITVLSPTLTPISPPVWIYPEKIPGSDELEFVYPILDEGYRLSTSKQEELFSSGQSMCKLFYTIEKIIAILVERLKGEGVDPNDEVQVAFDGHELSQRKGFEVIINLPDNLVVMNFDPGEWGERYLKMVKNLASLGKGYPPVAPRDVYRQSRQPGSPKPK